MQIDDDSKIEKIARELATWHGSAMSHSDRDGVMQTVASGYAGHRWAHASTDYANKKWQQYRGAARYVLAMIADERNECAKIADAYADACGSRDDDDIISARTGTQIADEIRSRITSIN